MISVIVLPFLLLGWLAVVIGIDQWPVAAQTNHILDGDLIVFPSVALSAIHPLFPFLLKRCAAFSLFFYKSGFALERA